MSNSKTTFLTIFDKIEDPRSDNHNKKHLLIDIITIAVCAVICRCESWYEVSEFGAHKKDWFVKFLELPNGIPSHDTFRRVFMILDPKEFNKSFVEWTALISKNFQREVIAIDGKTIRGSVDINNSKKAIHMVSAWASENGIVLSQLAVEHKSNEITAIPEVLKTLDIKNKIITIDAMGCQTEIAEQIRKQKGDYVLALKKNHLGLHQRVEEAFKKGFVDNFKGTKHDFFQETNEGRGRFEERSYFLIQEVDFLSRAKEWKDLSGVGLVESSVTKNGKSSFERRYYITSSKFGAEEFGRAVRSHWSVENNLHWILDVHFGDDADQKSAKNSAANFSLVKRMGLNLLKQEESKATMRSKRLKASCDDRFLEKVLKIG